MNSEPLKAVSNVIELKPNHKYMLIFRGKDITEEAATALTRTLNAQGIGGVIVHLAHGQSLDVVEIPEAER